MKSGKPLDALIQDDNNFPVQIGSSFQTYDASTSAKNSPLAYSSSIITIAVPARAVEFIVAPSTDMLISEDSAMTTYDTVVGGSKESIPVAFMSNVYIKRASADGTVTFRFTLI